MELVALWLGAALAIVAIAIVWRATARWTRIAVVVAMVAAAAAFARPHPRVAIAGPRVTDDGGYVGSGACRACHPSEHASWSRTYHRTMTQRGAGPIAITTGSHHMQGYWTEDDRGALHMLPYVYAYDEKKTIPRSEAFLEPPDAPQHDVRWSSNCIACHATSGRPHLDREGTRPSVAELGIACEACHGPGAAHVAREHDPIARYRSWRRRDAGDIVNPAKLSPERASAVCGQCHAYSFPKDEESFFASGYADAFRPGDALEPSRTLLTPKVLETTVHVDTDTRNLFWPDGTVRVGGREYNAMILSACWLRGEGERKLTCMSCHSMHASDPDDQLRKDRSVQHACISCHKMPDNHAHHANVQCVSCHMPKTSYALRTAIRSHRITRTQTPNACNLCHLDKPVSWATRETTRLWGTPVADVSDDLPASAYGLLAADAAERVIWADAFGDPDAIAASGKDWERPLLDAAARDPYAVIRFIAKRSASHYPAATRVVASEGTIDMLVSHRDNRDVYVAE